jgi:hypothetical protein
MNKCRKPFPAFMQRDWLIFVIMLGVTKSERNCLLALAKGDTCNPFPIILTPF